MSEATLNKWRDRVLSAGEAALSGKQLNTHPAEIENEQLKEALIDASKMIQILKKIQR
jgi:hypothetical protein